jgi:hypothetical protein
MSGYFGNSVTATLDGVAVGQLKSLTLPEVNFDTEDFTGLGDTFEDLCMVPIQSATDVEMTFSLDESVAAHRTIEALVGTNSNINLVLTFPWATNNTYTQAVVVKTLGSVDVSPKSEIIRSITLLTKAAGVWSTV